jgi:hypothetical protein
MFQNILKYQKNVIYLHYQQSNYLLKQLKNLNIMKLLKIGSIVKTSEVVGSVYCHEGDDYGRIIAAASAMNENFVEEQCIWPYNRADVLFEQSINNPKNKVIII